MKKIYLMFLLLAGLCLSPAAASETPTADSLLGHWQFKSFITKGWVSIAFLNDTLEFTIDTSANMLDSNLFFEYLPNGDVIHRYYGVNPDSQPTVQYGTWSLEGDTFTLVQTDSAETTHYTLAQGDGIMIYYTNLSSSSAGYEEYLSHMVLMARVLDTTGTLPGSRISDETSLYPTATTIPVSSPESKITMTVYTPERDIGVTEIKVTAKGVPPAEFTELKAVAFNPTRNLGTAMDSARLRFSYADLDVGDVDENSIGVYHRNGDEYVFYGGTVDTAAKSVVVTVPHFSVYSLLARGKTAGMVMDEHYLPPVPAEGKTLHTLEGRYVPGPGHLLPAGIYLLYDGGIPRKVLQFDRTGAGGND